MSFREFTISHKQPEKDKCNARIWLDSQTKEGYCELDGGGERCAQHNVKAKWAAAVERRRAALDDVGSLLGDAAVEVIGRAEELKKDKSSFMELDDEILRLAALIDYMEEKNPMLLADQIRKLKETKAKLIETRVNVEYKLHQILTTDMVFKKVHDLFEKHIVDQNSRKLIEQDFKVWLDSLLVGDEDSSSRTNPTYH